MVASDKPVLIIGAGVVGLTLAHGLKKVHMKSSSTAPTRLPYLGIDETTFARLFFLLPPLIKQKHKRSQSL
jgi:hypothetical protein